MKKELPVELKQAFAEALKYAKVVTIDEGDKIIYNIVAGDFPEDTEKKVRELVDKSLKKGFFVTIGKNTQWVEDEVILDFEKEMMYQWDKSGNKVRCEKVLYNRDADGNITKKVLKKIFIAFDKVFT
jgi:hypothetical protein